MSVQTASQRVAGQAVWSIAAKVATLGGTLGVSVIAARLLGKDEFGVWSLARNFVAFGVLLGSAGLDRALLRFVPELESVGSRRGIRRLVGAVFLAQVVLLIAASALLLLLAPFFRRLFMPELIPLLPVVCVVTAAFTLKETLYQLHFALARARVLAVATTITGAAWLLLTWWWLRAGGGSKAALGAQALALFAAIVYLLPSLRACLRDVASGSEVVLEPRRVTAYAGTQLGSSVVNLIVQRQSEVYFLAAVAPAAVIGFYDLGYSLPQLGLELIPLSLYGIVISAVTVSYHRDPTRLATLVGWAYKLFALVTVPFALLGLAWADRLVVLLYGPAMAPAGDIARFFSVAHLLPFVSLPVGIALNVVERAHRTLWFGLVQVVVNITLDILLIPRFKVPGAMAAVVLSFFLVTPATIRYAQRQTGDLGIPWGWMTRLTVVLSPALLPMIARPWLSGWGGLVVGLTSSAAIMAVGLRFGGLLGSEEIYRLKNISFPAKRFVLKALGV